MKKKDRSNNILYTKVVLILVETTSIPLLFLSIVMILTGYCIVNPRIVSLLTLGLLSLNKAYIIHTDPIIRNSFSILLFIHSLSGSILMINRYIRNVKMKSVTRFLVIILFTYLILLVCLAELF